MFLLLAFFTTLSWAHDQGVHLTEIHVLGEKEQNSLLQYIPSTTSLSGHELQKRREISLGDTLSSEAGVNATSFGPGASRPVIRGLDGDRIRILQNGLGTLDASAQSVDHAVPVDTLNVERIEIVRGPMSLLYGASAVGGVVNIVNQRIHTQFEEGAMTQLETQTQTGYGGMGNAARVDYGKSQWMFHADASLRDYGDQRIPGHARSRRRREAEPLPAGEESKDRVRNSQALQRSGSIGVSKIFSMGYLGLSFGHFSSDYGSIAEPEVEIKMRQNRWELGGEYRFTDSFFDKVRLRSAQSHYQHDEVEGGSVGTVFRNQGNESRLEFLKQKDNWSSVTGLQTQLFKFSAAGEEAYLPTSKNRILSVFNFNEFKVDRNSYSLGMRAEDHFVEKDGSVNFGESAERSFTGLNGSMGWQHRRAAFTYGINYSYTERAPTFQEMFADGEHLATSIYEAGDAGLKKERAHGAEFSVSHEDKKLKGRVSIYGQRFTDYIALTPTGVADGGSGLEINEYQAVDAEFYGTDLDTRYQWSPQWALLVKADYVRGKNLDNGQNIARLSPARTSVGLEFARNRWLSDVEVQQVFNQSKIPTNDSRTDGYQLVNLGSSYDFEWDENRLNLFLRLKNVFNVQARQHVSPLKDITPLVGRNLVAGLQLIF